MNYMTVEQPISLGQDAVTAAFFCSFEPRYCHLSTTYHLRWWVYIEFISNANSQLGTYK